jgi:hypothetical protein
MTTSGSVHSTQSYTGGSASAHQSLTVSAKQEIERLTEKLFFPNGGTRPKSVLMMDLGEGKPSLWVATSAAEALSNALDQVVYVLIVDGDASQVQTVPSASELGRADAGCVLERITETPGTAEGTKALMDRVSALVADGHTVIIHLPYQEEQARSLPRIDFVSGIVLLVRASRTYRAAIEAIERKLDTAGVPLLGFVLLDRNYPIPVKVYRLL